jgi:AcrR family transcriptional regulator
MITEGGDEGTYHKILNATIYLIKEKGVSSVKVREIAKLADVNIAAINYHFQSKERLICVAFNQLFPSIKDALARLDDKSVPAKERLKNILQVYIENLLQFPEPLKHFFIAISQMPENQKNLIQLHQEFQLDNLDRMIAEITGLTDKTKLRILKMQLVYAAMMPSLMNTLAKKVEGPELPDLKTQIDILVEQFFG